MNIAILAVCSLNLVVTVTVIVIAKKKANEAKAEFNLMRDKTNGIIKSFSRLEF